MDNKNTIWIYGVHPVLEVLNSGRKKIKRIIATEKFIEKSRDDKNLSGFNIQKIKPQEFTRFLGEEVTHQGVAVEIEKPQLLSLEDFLNNNSAAQKIVILDQITDSGNVGAIIRSMVAFDLKDLFVLEHNAIHDYGKIAKASSGLSEKINIYQIGNLNQAIDKLKEQEYWCIGLDGESRATVKELQKFDKIALILGSEGRGVRDLVKKNCDLLVKIPMSPEAESLNVSNAAAIVFYCIHNK